MEPAARHLLVGTLVYLSGVAFRLPCRITAAGQPPPTSSTCATPISGSCTRARPLQGNTPYLDHGAYPVLGTQCSPAGFWNWSV